MTTTKSPLFFIITLLAAGLWPSIAQSQRGPQKLWVDQRSLCHMESEQTRMSVLPMLGKSKIISDIRGKEFLRDIGFLQSLSEQDSKAEQAQRKGRIFLTKKDYAGSVSLRKNDKNRWPTYVFLGISVASGIAASIVKNSADDSFDKYLHSANPRRIEDDLKSAERRDKVAGLLWGVSGISFVASWYLILF